MQFSTCVPTNDPSKVTADHLTLFDWRCQVCHCAFILLFCFHLANAGESGEITFTIVFADSFAFYNKLGNYRGTTQAEGNIWFYIEKRIIIRKAGTRPLNFAEKARKCAAKFITACCRHLLPHSLSLRQKDRHAVFIAGKCIQRNHKLCTEGSDFGPVMRGEGATPQIGFFCLLSRTLC